MKCWKSYQIHTIKNKKSAKLINKYQIGHLIFVSAVQHENLNVFKKMFYF